MNELEQFCCLDHGALESSPRSWKRCVDARKGACQELSLFAGGKIKGDPFRFQPATGIVQVLLFTDKQVILNNATAPVHSLFAQTWLVN